VKSQGSESEMLMSQHAMKMGFYTINLGTDHGQRLHTCHIGRRRSSGLRIQLGRVGFEPGPRTQHITTVNALSGVKYVGSLIKQYYKTLNHDIG
jgi:hypothetical protein